MRLAAGDVRRGDVTVGRGERELLAELGAVHVDRQRARRHLRDGIVQVERVSRAGQRELHVLAGGGRVDRFGTEP